MRFFDVVEIFVVVGYWLYIILGRWVGLFPINPTVAFWWAWIAISFCIVGLYLAFRRVYQDRDCPEEPKE